MEYVLALAFTAGYAFALALIPVLVVWSLSRRFRGLLDIQLYLISIFLYAAWSWLLFKVLAGYMPQLVGALISLLPVVPFGTILGFAFLLYVTHRLVHRAAAAKRAIDWRPVLLIFVITCVCLALYAATHPRIIDPATVPQFVKEKQDYENMVRESGGTILPR